VQPFCRVDSRHGISWAILDGQVAFLNLVRHKKNSNIEMARSFTGTLLAILLEQNSASVTMCFELLGTLELVRIAWSRAWHPPLRLPLRARLLWSFVCLGLVSD
jgi:hypothetical protein